MQAPTLRYYSEYSEEELQQIVGEMAALVVCIENSKFQAVRTKYSGTKFLKISRLSVLKEDWIRKLASPYVKKILPDKEWNEPSCRKSYKHKKVTNKKT